MIDYLVDTNIVIYLLDQNKFIMNFFEKEIPSAKLGISVITLMEVLIGIDKMNWNIYLEHLLERYEIINLDFGIGISSTSYILSDGLKRLLKTTFMNYVIASTALQLNVPLVTNNLKDFKMFKDLKLITPNDQNTTKLAKL